MIPWREANRLVILRSEATWESREGTADLERLSLKWHAPIASVAAVSDRLWQLQIWRYFRRMCKAPKLVIARRPKADVAISGRQLRFRR